VCEVFGNWVGGLFWGGEIVEGAREGGGGGRDSKLVIEFQSEKLYM